MCMRRVTATVVRNLANRAEVVRMGNIANTIGMVCIGDNISGRCSRGSTSHQLKKNRLKTS